MIQISYSHFLVIYYFYIVINILNFFQFISSQSIINIFLLITIEKLKILYLNISFFLCQYLLIINLIIIIKFNY